jgi:transcriptional antiterminator RfaH
MNDVDWFALHVRPRYEKIAAASIASKGHESFLPLYTARRRWSDRAKELQLPLFEGYLFCRLSPRERLGVLMAPGVIRLVGAGKTPIPVAVEEIEALRTVVQSGVRAQPWPYLKIGQRVRIERGPLRDLEGFFVQARGFDRLVLAVNLLQRSVAVEIDREWVSPVSLPTSWAKEPNQLSTIQNFI